VFFTVCTACNCDGKDMNILIFQLYENYCVFLTTCKKQQRLQESKKNYHM